MKLCGIDFCNHNFQFSPKLFTPSTLVKSIKSMCQSDSPMKNIWKLKKFAFKFAPSSRRQECHQPSRASHGGKTMRTNSQNKC